MALVMGVMPFVRGRAWITAEGTLTLEASDPFRHGIVPPYCAPDR